MSGSFSTLSEPTASLVSRASEFEQAPSYLLPSRSLQERVDIKYVLPPHLAGRVLDSVHGDYLLAFKPENRPGDCLAHYRTVWFDTPDLHCYHRARQAAVPHQKVRIRQYSDLREAFFEVKCEAKGQTLKHRLIQQFDEETLTDAAKRLVRRHTAIPVDGLSPSAVIVFHRITLLSRHGVERVTIDLDIDFDGAQPGAGFDNVVIVEVKQSEFAKETPIMRALSNHDVPSIRASKYCTTMALKDPSLPREHVQAFLRSVRDIQSTETAASASMDSQPADVRR